MTAIGLLELDTHAHVLNYLTRAAGGPEREVTVFTTEVVAEEAFSPDGPPEGVKTVYQLPGESLRDYLKRTAQASEELDLLVILSMFWGSRDLLTFRSAGRFDCPTALYINNVNQWMGRGPTIDRSVASRRLIKHNLRQFVKRRLLGRFDSVFVEFPAIADHVSEEMAADVPVYVFPPTLFERYRPPEDNPVRFVVPGNIDVRRRDYAAVLNAMNRVLEVGTAGLTLVGRPVGSEGQTVVARAKSLALRGHDIRWFDEWVPAERFAREIRSGSVVVLPQRERKGLGERYGVTSGAGGVFEAIRHARPLILPDHFPVPEWVDSSTLTYADTQELAENLVGLVTDHTRRQDLQRAAHLNAGDFDESAQRARFGGVLEAMREDGVI
jgi:glycosyltransferase involved in cell wall biosynthesis